MTVESYNLDFIAKIIMLMCIFSFFQIIWHLDIRELNKQLKRKKDQKSYPVLGTEAGILNAGSISSIATLINRYMIIKIVVQNINSK